MVVLPEGVSVAVRVVAGASQAALSLCACRYRSPGSHVQSWYDEVKDYTYPYPHECNPWCPERCSGLMCTHYTQVRLEDRAWPQPGTP